ncbi:acetylornithine deacetylase/succinyl-diaminopimelate desuccinylase-like protein [Variovorax boronicumulans]|uniref:Acetylornithine deacetylase/succinyl-diaminopimelate desuccinylase-like protein n=1 Tax=Variovorax boronicumulans TaxID=436515 RepID=A0AAW8E4F3_9BURK|nr:MULTISPECIES: M20 family metallopeptidase [Variovorax]MDP9881616.1 acetylornithine deacetylase/succinyl-diaminopimelate desuccinylase-like protein [Variovorax boronicumulans]MDP9914805.1 acetylornithine deacetylase/succinyl-diaminopimelate desuccinylase-like protein [Variovorax boronicumulans]MDP9927071.1 acetylornithine deacetylase/succinyl-diaminopimelate desuccinylase-like protein [Variovorax boronicumulans]TSD53859.1 M20/M25/M40 family metallo-hydrolase [Variovorax sp. KBS0712]
MNAPLHREMPAGTLDATRALSDVTARWDGDIVKQLTDYIAIPAKSPGFDKDWSANGYLETVLRNAAAWVEAQKVEGLKLEIVRLEGRTPVLFFEVPATGTNMAETVLMYGHLDKQPEFTGWRNDLGPWTPKYENGLLYGRGGADDGYAVYASVAALQALKAQGVAHPRIVGLIETCEESGSYDLLPYVDALRPRLGEVELVICLDSGAGNYDQLWLTTSLRGMASGTLKVEVLTEGIHSGDASGLVPSSFRIMRQVLDRLEDSATGRLLPASFHCEVPADRLAQAKATAAILGDEVYKRFPWAHYDCGGSTMFALPTTTDPVEALLNRTWKPTLSVTGAEGFPALKDAGNVLRPYTAFKLSLRLPPLVDAAETVQKLKALLEDNAPYQARVTFESGGGATGWNAPTITPWFEDALNKASRAHFGASCGYIGQGGTIPLMNMLSAGFPTAQMMVCGVLGPKSNAHGPNEFLHVPYAKKLTAAVAEVIAALPVAHRAAAAEPVAA